jgi:hypothetical protein
MQKIKSKLALFVILTSLCDLTGNLFPRFFLFNWLSILSVPFRFDFEIRGLIHYSTLNQFFCILFLISGIIYYTSKGKESRLLRFLFSVILIDRLIRVLKLLMLIVFSFNSFIEKSNFIYILLSFIANLAWFYISFRVLKSFNQQKKIQIKTEDYGGDIVNYFIVASNWQRIFHLVVDSFILLIVFYPLIETFIRIEFTVSLLKTLSLIIGERTTGILIFVFFKLIFYLFFEKLFQSSPAKFLTETRVVNNSEAPFTLKTTFLRTASRFVPFDIVSFIFAHNGWHDQWSDTSVIKEEQTGAKGWKYFLAIPVAIILIFLIQFSSNYVDFYLENRTVGNKLKEKIDNLTIDDFIEFRNVKNGNTVVYLKPERVNGTEITCSLITMDNNYEYHAEQENIDAFYDRNKNVWPSITINKNELREGLPENFVRAKYGSIENNGKGIILKNVYGQYVIKSIEPYMLPILKVENVSVFANSPVIIRISNNGRKVKILKIETPGHQINWYIRDSIIQKNIHGNTIIGYRNESLDKITVKLKVQDTLGKAFTYNIIAKQNAGDISKIK